MVQKSTYVDPHTDPPIEGDVVTCWIMSLSFKENKAWLSLFRSPWCLLLVAQYPWYIWGYEPRNMRHVTGLFQPILPENDCKGDVLIFAFFFFETCVFLVVCLEQPLCFHRIEEINPMEVQVGFTDDWRSGDIDTLITCYYITRNGCSRNTGCMGLVIW